MKLAGWGGEWWRWRVIGLSARVRAEIETRTLLRHWQPSLTTVSYKVVPRWMNLYPRHPDPVPLQHVSLILYITSAAALFHSNSRISLFTAASTTPRFVDFHYEY